MLRDSHLQLVTLGRLALVAPEGAEDAALGKQRRKLAVLAVLALQDRPISRDTLVEMFWGDQEEARARHSLSDALSHLRRALGPEAVTTRRAEVALAENVALRVDAVEFAEAVTEGAYQRALDLYGGPFLEAVYVGGSARFSEWADRERRRLEDLFLRACDEWCQALAEEGRWDECARVALRWVDADPLSADAAVTLLDALRAPGTPDAEARALREYERLRARLDRDFGLTPAAAVEELAGQVRSSLGSVVEAPSGTSAEVPPPPHFADAQPDTAPASGPESSPTRRARPPWAALVLAVAALAAALLLSRPGGARAPDTMETVAVLPFAVHGSAELGYLRTGMVDLLSTSLDGVGAFRTIDPRAVLASLPENAGTLAPAEGQAAAARFDAALFVLGDVVAAGDRVRVTARLYDGRGAPRPIASATVEGHPSDLFRLVDGLTARLLAARPRTPGGRLASTAAMTTTSLPALKAYLEGEDHYRGGRYALAFDAFERAAAQDSTFGLAHFRLSQSGLWTGLEWDSIIGSSARAVRHGSRLNRRTRLLVESFDAWQRGAHDEAERLNRLVVAAHPSDVDAWYQLAEVLFHSNPLRGRSFAEAREPLQRVLTLEPDHQPALVHLVRIAAREGRRQELDSLVARATALMPDQDEGWIRALHAFSSGSTADRERVIAQLRGEPDEMVRISAERVAVYARDLEGAERILQLLVQPPRLPEARAWGHIHLAELELTRGRWRAAQSHLAAAARLAPALALEHRALLAQLPFLHRPATELSVLRDTLQRWNVRQAASAWPAVALYNGLHSHIRAYLVGLLSVRLSDAAGVERSARTLDELATRGDAEAREFARGLAESLRAHDAAARGRPRAALAGLGRARLNVSEGLLALPLGSQALDRFARAEALRALGRDQEALRWYASLAESTLHQVAIYLAPAHLRQAEIHERMGDARRAAEHYAAVAIVWEDADPEVRPAVEHAQRRLRHLRTVAERPGRALRKPL